MNWVQTLDNPSPSGTQRVFMAIGKTGELFSIIEDRKEVYLHQLKKTDEEPDTEKRWRFCLGWLREATMSTIEDCKAEAEVIEKANGN